MRKTGTKKITVEEAINILLSLKKMTFYPTEAIAIDMATDALESKSKAEEYRTPKKPIYGSMGGCKCPTCGENICSADADHFCPYCGQALDWSEVEE